MSSHTNKLRNFDDNATRMSLKTKESFKNSSFKEETKTILTPLLLDDVFGRSKITPILNLSTNNRTVIAYSCSHVLIILDYLTNEKKIWQGHKNVITSLSTDKFGKWLVSSDRGHDNLIIVWDFENLIPYCTFQPDYCTYLVKISPNAEYIVSLSSINNATSCYLWVITGKRKKASGCYSLDPKHGMVRNIEFSLDFSNHFMLTTTKTVIFISWDTNDKENINIEVHYPPALQKGIRGKLMESVYLQSSSKCLTSTINGYILVWNENKINESLEKCKTPTNKKTLEKSYNLQPNGMTVLRQINELVITGDDLGVIRFYDYNLCLLYWTQEMQLPQHLKQVEFNIQEREYYLRIDWTSNINGLSRRCHFPKISSNDKDSTSPTSLYQFTDKILPTDCTKEGNIFIVQDFIVVDDFGCCYFVDFLKNTCHIICETTNSSITSMDIHPERPVITLGNAFGEITMLNYETDQFIYSKLISDITDEKNKNITCIKYASKGSCIAVGMEGGTVLLIDPCLYEPIQEKPFNLSSTKIIKICFSPDDEYMAYADERNCVMLCGSISIVDKDEQKMHWISCGRICSHYKRISDLKFDPSPIDCNRLFSIGYDRLLVEYSIECSEDNGIEIYTRSRIEQSAYPIYLNWSFDSFGEKCLLIANSEFKYKIYDQINKQYCQTIQGFVYDSPISYFQMLNIKENNNLMVFGTDTLIGIQLLPLDGNPFKSLGIIAHPVKVANIAFSHVKNLFFSVGDNETCILKWNVNDRSIKTLYEQGGEGLKPYYCLLEGGENGRFFQQAMDYFYLGQILHDGRLWESAHRITPFLKTCELVHVMRSLGYFPTEQETENMMHEVFNNVYNSEKKETNKISFKNFMCLFINHRPAKGITLEQFATNFNILSKGSKEISREMLHQILREEGEIVEKTDISKCLNLLLKDMDSDKIMGSLTSLAIEEFSQNLTQTVIEDDLLGISTL